MVVLGQLNGVQLRTSASARRCRGEWCGRFLGVYPVGSTGFLWSPERVRGNASSRD